MSKARIKRDNSIMTSSMSGVQLDIYCDILHIIWLTGLEDQSAADCVEADSDMVLVLTPLSGFEVLDKK